MAAAVIITVCDGTVDFCSEGNVKVVLVDFDRHNLHRSFPDDVDRDISLLRALPEGMPWAGELCHRLGVIRGDIAEGIRSEPPPEVSTN